MDTQTDSCIATEIEMKKVKRERLVETGGPPTEIHWDNMRYAEIH